jgi:hypothetical protein
VSEAERDVAKREAERAKLPAKTKGETLVEEALGTQGKGANENPTMARTEKSPLSERPSEPVDTHIDKGTAKFAGEKPSVREKLNGYKAAAAKQKEKDRVKPEAAWESQTMREQPGQTAYQPMAKAKTQKRKER